MIERKGYLSILVGLFILLGLYLVSLKSYLLFHSVAEIFSIFIAFSIFILAWNSRRFIDNAYILFIGIAYLFVGGIDLIHTLAYKGMGVFPGFSANLPTQLWIGARYLEGLSLLIAPFLLGKRLRMNVVLMGYTLISALFILAIFSELFPLCFVEGVGLTPFKKISEYVISLILFASIFMLFKKRSEFDLDVLRLLIASIIVTIFSELVFTFYVHVYGLSNFIGHCLKIISFYFIYKAIIETGLTKPFSLLLRDLKQSEEELRKFKTISDKAGYGVLIIDLKGIILYANDALARMHGYKTSEIIGKNHSLFHDEEEHGRAKFLKERLLREGGTLTVEELHQRKDGSTFPILAHVLIIRDKKGLPIFISAIIMDITAKKRAEDALRVSEERFREITENIREVFWMFDWKEQRVIYVSPAYEEVWGRSIQALYNRYEEWADCIHPDDLSFAKESFSRIVQTGGGEERKYRIIRPDGKICWISDRGFAVYEGDGKVRHIVGVAEDITERKEAEVVLQRSKEELEIKVKQRTKELHENMERLIESEEKYRMLARRLLSVQEEQRRRLARELHDDLTQRLAILAIDVGKLEQSEQDLPETFLEKLKGIREGLVRISEDVHAISRQLHPSILDDLGLIDAIKSESNRFTRVEGIKINLRKRNLPPKIPKDISLCIYRVIQSGLINIAKHAKASKINISLIGRNNTLCLTIKDNGVGFDMEKYKKKPGLGLESMKERIYLIHGDFSMKSQPGKGTELKAKVPL